MKKLFLIIIFLFLINVNSVNAKEITLNDIKDKINEKALNIEASVSNNELIINNRGNLLAFNFNNNILSRTNTYPKKTFDSVNDIYIYLTLTKTIAYLKGYQVKEIEYFLTSLDDAKMNNVGYEITKTTTEENLELTYKIDLNNFKINLDYIEAKKPNVKIEESSSNEVKLSITLDDNREVDLYRSIDNKNYEYLTTLDITKGITTYYNNHNIESGNTYYYKAVVKKANNYSDVVKVSFPKEKIDTNYLDEETENPLTGYEEFLGVSMLVLIAIISVISNINLKKKVYR